jgi:DNA replication protein DnaC
VLIAGADSRSRSAAKLLASQMEVPHEPRTTSFPAEFLLRLLTDEVERRTPICSSSEFEHSRMLAGIDFHFNPQLPKSRIIDLATAGFVVQRRSVLLLGPSGVGKSHIAQALGQRACSARS